jgi:hypothetical protein
MEIEVKSYCAQFYKQRLNNEIRIGELILRNGFFGKGSHILKKSIN